MARNRIEEIKFWLKVESKFIKEEYKENEVEISPSFSTRIKTSFFKKYFLQKNQIPNYESKFVLLYPSMFILRKRNYFTMDKIYFGLFKGEFYIKFSDDFYLFKSKLIDTKDETINYYTYKIETKNEKRMSGIKYLDDLYGEEFLNYLNDVGFL